MNATKLNKIKSQTSIDSMINQKGEEVRGKEMKKVISDAWTKLGLEDISDEKFDVDFAKRINISGIN